MPKTPRYVQSPNREQAALLKFMERHGINVSEWAKKAGMGESTLRKPLTTPNATIRRGTLTKLAGAYGLTVEQLLAYVPSVKVSLTGYIGAGNVVHMFEGDVSQGDVVQIDAPAGLDHPEDAAALEIRGDSMLPMEDGWKIFYRKSHDGVTADEIGRICVVKLQSGGLLLKKLRRGYSTGLFNLESWNAPLMEDQAIEWATPVVAIVPR